VHAIVEALENPSRNDAGEHRQRSPDPQGPETLLSSGAAEIGRKRGDHQNGFQPFAQQDHGCLDKGCVHGVTLLVVRTSARARAIGVPATI
jgi:hypothetical protein